MPLNIVSTSGIAYTGNRVFDLTTLEDIPSGVQDGDIGIYQNAAYEYYTFSAANTPDGVARSLWIPPMVAAGSPVLRAYALGDEDVSDDVELTAQGWSTITRTNGTITTTDTNKIRLAGTAANGEARITATLSNYANKCYTRASFRGQVSTATSGASSSYLILPALQTGSRVLYPAVVGGSESKGVFFWTGSGSASAGTDATQSAIPSLASALETLELHLMPTNSISRLCRSQVNVSAALNIAGIGTPVGVSYWAGSASAATQHSTVDLQFVYVIEYT